MSGKTNHALRALGLLFLGTLGLWGCSEATRPLTPAPAPAPAQSPNQLSTIFGEFEELKLDTTMAEADTLVSKLVNGLVGGTVTGEEVSLDFPVLSLPAIHEVRIIRLAPNSPVYELDIEPYTTFSQDVKLSVYYGDFNFGSETPYIVWFDEDKGEWVKLDSYDEPDTKTVHVLLQHFSLYGVTADPPSDGTSGWGKADTKGPRK